MKRRDWFWWFLFLSSSFAVGFSIFAGVLWHIKLHEWGVSVMNGFVAAWWSVVVVRLLRTK